MSTARHTYAGYPGTGTVTDNMKSRVKAYATINNPAVTLAILDSFNTSTVTDNGVGTFSHYYTAPLANAYSPRLGHNTASASNNGWIQANQAQLTTAYATYACVYMNGTTPAVFDPAVVFFAMMGDLA